ncbi:MAG TPA: acetate kinase [Acidimicrobiia bacterium]|jgi:acetate kinase
MRVLVLNCGSSSIKYRLFDDEEPVAKGIVERIGQHDSEVPDHRSGLRRVLEALAPHIADGGLDAIGHRVVHGGEEFVRPTVIDDDVIDRIRAQIPLAPLHNPANLLGIEVAVELEPHLPQVAIFDTAFHRTLPPRAFRYAMPESTYRDHGVRRYGFHGTSHAHVAQLAAEHLRRPLTELNLITLHLGNGASATAIERGESVDTSMGMSPLEGLVMGSRSGDIDPAIVFHLERSAGMTNDEVESMLNRQSGLLGLCGDMDLREVERRAAEGDADAALALDVYGYRIKKYVGAYLAVLGTVHAVVFTGGVGENQPDIRRRALEGLDDLGIDVDQDLNRTVDLSAGPVAIQSNGSRTAVLVIPTNEELEIARSVRQVVLSD